VSAGEVFLELAKLGAAEKAAKRQFAFDMAQKQGELVEKVVGSLLKLAGALCAPPSPSALRPSPLDEDYAPKGQSAAETAHDQFRQYVESTHGERSENVRLLRDMLHHANLELSQRNDQVADMLRQFQELYDRRSAPAKSLVEDAIAQVGETARMNLLAGLRGYEEKTAVGVLELFFADVEAKKAPKMGEGERREAGGERAPQGGA
jgi:hypothetical protein